MFYISEQNPTKGKLEMAAIAGLIGYESLATSKEKADQDLISDAARIFRESGILAGKIAGKLEPSPSVIVYGLWGGIMSGSEMHPKPESADQYRQDALSMSVTFYAMAHAQTRLLLEKGLLMRGGMSCGKIALEGDAGPAIPLAHAIDIWRSYRWPLIVVHSRTYKDYLKCALKGGLVDKDAGLRSIFIQLDDGHMGLDYMRAQRFLEEILRKNGARCIMPMPFFGYEEHRNGLLLSIEKNKSLILSDPETEAMYRWLIQYHNESARLLLQDCFIDESVLDPPAQEPVEPADKGLLSRLKRHRNSMPHH